MNNQSLIVSTTRDDVTKKRLQKIIKKKRVTLATVTAKYELLKLELDIIKREYYVRVGSLFDRDNQLDLEIMRFKNILAYMKKGLSFEDAMKELRGTFLDDEEVTVTPEDTFSYEEFIQHTEGDPKKKKSLKDLWKKAVMKFHPDLADDPEEKKEREAIMKRLNNAYAEGDYETLMDIYNNNHVVNAKETTVEDLEKILISVESMIMKIKRDMAELRQTEWYGWRTKMKYAKKNGLDVFRELEKSLLDDIVKKVHMLTHLKRKAGVFV